MMAVWLGSSRTATGPAQASGFESLALHFFNFHKIRFNGSHPVSTGWLF